MTKQKSFTKDGKTYDVAREIDGEFLCVEQGKNWRGLSLTEEELNKYLGVENE